MLKTKGNFWIRFEIIFDNEKEKYKCKTYSGIWVKNALHLKEHFEKCNSFDIETKTSQP